MFYEEAIKQCHKSSYKKRLGAIVVYKNKIVGRGFNKVHSTGVPNLDGRHAEIEALRDTLARRRKGSTVYVCRLGRSGDLRLARPCKSCQSVMRKMGVKYVWYSTDREWIRMEL